MNEIVDHLANFEANVLPDVFAALKDEQEKAYRNYSLKPSKLITYGGHSFVYACQILCLMHFILN